MNDYIIIETITYKVRGGGEDDALDRFLKAEDRYDQYSGEVIERAIEPADGNWE